MSSVDLWCETLNGPHRAAHASPLSMCELAKKTLFSDVKPRPT